MACLYFLTIIKPVFIAAIMMNPESPTSPVKFCRLKSALLFLTFIVCMPVSVAADNPEHAQRETATIVPRPDHVVIVIEENKSYEQINGNQNAPYINLLAGNGALFTQSFGVTHPSQPNYLALFSGSTHGITSDDCPLPLSGANLASELTKKGLSFGIYSESMPAAGYAECYAESRLYARKHNPTVNWQGQNVPPEINMPFMAFPRDFTKLPTISIVIPNQENDMHNGWNRDDAIKLGDSWLRNTMDAYVQWTKTHNSLLLLTWDEDDSSSNNHIPTILVGPMIKPGRYDMRIDHYSVLRTLEEMYGLAFLGNTVDTQPLQNIWNQ